MNGEGSGKSTLEFGGGHFGKGEVREEEKCGVENDRGNKRIKEMPIDRFGELPDSLVIHILSFLNVKEAAITCVLSKRWQYLWAELPRLGFPYELPRLDIRGDSGEIEKVRSFVSWVNRLLAIRTTNNLEEFDVTIIFYKCFNSDVDAWVQFAVENKVKKLNLHFECCSGVYYIPPQVMYSCPSLTTLRLKGCIMDSKRTIEWQSLTHLHLHDSILDERLFDEILSSCPVLYGICLEGCSGFYILEVNSRSLHSLSIVESEYENTCLEISAPYIHSLYISLLMVGSNLQLGNISSLDRVDIDYKGYSWESSSVEVMSGAKELLESVEHVKGLHVGLQFIEVVSMMVVSGWQLPQSRRELLVVASASEYELSISGIIGLLESSANLETLVIEGSSKEGEDVVLEPAAEDDLACDLLHLKTIKVKNFADSKGEPALTLARILLKRAIALEELAIMTDGKDLRGFAKMAQTMLTYPRSSTKAVVHLVN